jgi:hypothetical protein
LLDENQETIGAPVEILVTKVEAPLQVDWLSPSEGLVVGEELHLEWQASSNLKKIEVFDGDTLVSKLESAPWKASFHRKSLTTSGDVPLHVRYTSNEDLLWSDVRYVHVGQGSLRILPPEGKSSSVAGSAIKVQFVLDASAEQSQQWGAQSKWNTLVQTLAQPEFEASLKGVRTGFLVAGTQKEAESIDCKDAEVVFPMANFSSIRLGKILQSKQPRGVSAVWHAIELAAERKPDKIIVIAADSSICLPKKIPEFLSNDTMLHIDWLFFDTPSEALQEAIKSWNIGKFSVIPQPDELLPLLKKSFQPVFRITRNSKLLAEEILGETISYPPGDYMLTVPSIPELGVLSVTLSPDYTLEGKPVFNGDAPSIQWGRGKK